MIVQTFREIAQAKDWYFEYGRPDFHNLYDLDDQKTFKFFLDPLEENHTLTDIGNTSRTTYTGRFMLLKKSDLEEVYDGQLDTNIPDGKYKRYIEPCKDEIKSIITDLSCQGVQIASWRILEIINVYDVNLDGIIVEFVLQYDQ